MTSSSPRIVRSNDDLKAALSEQVKLLLMYCQHYDKGEQLFSKPMATALRVLLHDKPNSSRSVLHLLGLDAGDFASVASHLNPRALASEHGLVYMQFGSNGPPSFEPSINMGCKQRLEWWFFPDWWAGPVIKGIDGRTMSRRDIVLAVTNMDGGAHVDPSVTSIYDSFCTGKFFGITAGRGEEDGQHFVFAQYACIRAIAHELLMTLDVITPWCFQHRYKFAVDRAIFSEIAAWGWAVDEALLPLTKVVAVGVATRLIRGHSVFVAAHMGCRLEPEYEGSYTMFVWPCFAHEFRDTDCNPEWLALKLFFDRYLRSSTDERVSVVVAPHLKRFEEIASRAAPILDDFYLPEWATLILADTDARDTQLKTLMRLADGESVRLLDRIEAENWPGKSDEPIPQHISFVRLWTIDSRISTRSVHIRKAT